MFFSAAAVPLALLWVSSASATVFDVVVGSANGSTIYTPNNLNASAGDKVVFHFEQKNHTATQSSFPDPCTHLEGGFDSGFNPVAANVTGNFPTFTITVNDTKPIWAYCRQAANTSASHCGAGMVFAVNPGPQGANNSFANFQAEALAIGASLKASAASASAAASTASASGAASTTPPSWSAPTPVVVTKTVTVTASSWVTVTRSSPGSSQAASGSPPQATSGSVHTIIVGGSDGQLTYSPANITAQPHDTISFQFHQKNHTATESSFADPCRILTNATTGAVIGVDSGFMPVDANATTFPTFNVTINDTTPTWFYCKQHTPTGASHCGMGMVFAVNAVANSPKNFSAFQALAIQLNGTNSTNGTGGTLRNANGARTSAATNLAFGAGAAFALVAALLS